MTRLRRPEATTSWPAVFRTLGHSHWNDPELAHIAAAIRKSPDLVAEIEHAADDGAAWEELVQIAEANSSGPPHVPRPGEQGARMKRRSLPARPAA